MSRDIMLAERGYGVRMRVRMKTSDAKIYLIYCTCQPLMNEFEVQRSETLGVFQVSETKFHPFFEYL
jgi:hypothetical protein